MKRLPALTLWPRCQRYGNDESRPVMNCSSHANEIGEPLSHCKVQMHLEK